MPTVAGAPASSLIHSWSGVYLTVMAVLLVVWLWRSAAVVALRHEGHGGDLHRHRLATDDGVEPGARGRMRRRDVRHRDGLVDGGPEQAAGDFADLGARCILQLRVLAHRDALQSDEADTLARDGHGAIELAEHAMGAGEPTGARATGATHLLHRPVQAGFDRCRGGV